MAGIVRRHQCRDNATISVQNLTPVNNLVAIDVTFRFLSASIRITGCGSFLDIHGDNGVLGDIESPCKRTDITQTTLTGPADRDLKGLRRQSQIATK